MQKNLSKFFSVISIILLLISAPLFAACSNDVEPNVEVPNKKVSNEEVSSEAETSEKISEAKVTTTEMLDIKASDVEKAEQNISADKLIKPFIATYDLLKKSDSVGEAIRKLEYPDKHSAHYSYKTKARWLIFSDVREETSVSKFNNNRVTPTHYLFKRKGTGKDKQYEWTFDVENDLASDLKKAKQFAIKFPEKIQDKLSYQLQLRLDLIKNPSQEAYSYPVISTSGKIKDYIFVNEGEETITLPFGQIKAIKLKREVTDKKKITYAWFAPELNYLLVQLYQMKNGKGQFNALLKTVDLLETGIPDSQSEKKPTN